MTSKECKLIRELLPLYAEKLVSEETAEYIEQHLRKCDGCTCEWETFNSSLPDPLPTGEVSFTKTVESSLLNKLRKTGFVAMLLLVVCGAGLAYASYNAGKHVGTDDPVYRFAQELGLFTEIGQTKTMDDVQVTVEKGLFESTRSILFVRFSKPVDPMLQTLLTDENGQWYEQKSGKGWQNKYFMLEFEPLKVEAEQVSFSLDMNENDHLEFTFPVDMVKTAQYTKIVYPNQEKKTSNLRITFDKAVLGVSEAEFKVRLDWPVDGSVAGIALGESAAHFHTSVFEVPDETSSSSPGAPPGGLSSGYAAAHGEFYRPQDPSMNRPVLYDLTDRQEVMAESSEYRTSQFPCQVEAIMKFAPVKQETEHLELHLPPIYVYQEVEDSPRLYLDFQDEDEIKPAKVLPYHGGNVIIEKVWMEDGRVYLDYKTEPYDDDEITLPHFVLTDTQEMKQGKPYFDRERSQVIMFPTYNEETKEFYLTLDSMGYLQPREKFILDLRE